MTAIEIQSQFGIPDTLRFEEAPGGLIRAVISTPLADATLYLHGAHLTAWTPRCEAPVLFTSSKSNFETGKPIRGGVPIAFPWFGPRADGIPGPLHGFARVMEWTVESTELQPGGAVAICLALTQDAYHLRFRVTAGASLEMELEVHNQSPSPCRFEEALHTYFAVADIHRVSVTGLAGTTYIDKTDAAQRKLSPEAISFTRETDQVHLNTTSTCKIYDSVLQRVIIVEKEGSDTTVVWNPWIEKNRSIGDMAPDDWQSMVCVETANALDNAIELPEGGVHRMRALIRIARR